MADQINKTTSSEPSSGNAGIAFIVGGLVVGVVVLAYVVFGGDIDTGKDVNISIKGAAEAVEGAAGTAEKAADGN